MSISLEKNLLNTRYQIDQNLSQLIDQTVEELRNSETGKIPAGVRGVIIYLLTFNHEFEIDFIDEENNQHFLFIENETIVTEDEIGILPVIVVTVTKDTGKGDCLVTDSIYFPTEEIDNAIDCFTEIFWKKDSLDYEGMRWSFEDIKKYTIYD